MGFYIRKALGLGPLRFNLSKSGVGLSLGVTGLRVGIGPKGPYLHAGREGLYYRKSLRRREQRQAETDDAAVPAPDAASDAAGSSTFDRMLRKALISAQENRHEKP